MSIHDRPHEVDAQSKILLEGIEAFDHAQHPVIRIEGKAADLTVSTKPLWQIEFRIVSNRGYADRSVQTKAPDPGLKLSEFSDRQRAFLWIVAARVKERHNRGLTFNEFLKGQGTAI